jgi:hypothetical protein
VCCASDAELVFQTAGIGVGIAALDVGELVSFLCFTTHVLRPLDVRNVSKDL